MLMSRHTGRIKIHRPCVMKCKDIQQSAIPENITVSTVQHIEYINLWFPSPDFNKQGKLLGAVTPENANIAEHKVNIQLL